MCELLGMNCNVPTDIVFSFSGFSKRATEHADGFGIAFFENKGVRCFVDAQAADQSPVAELVRRYPIRSTQGPSRTAHSTRKRSKASSTCSAQAFSASRSSPAGLWARR